MARAGSGKTLAKDILRSCLGHVGRLGRVLWEVFSEVFSVSRTFQQLIKTYILAGYLLPDTPPLGGKFDMESMLDTKQCQILCPKKKVQENQPKKQHEKILR